ncbi:nucleotidyltransferase domain-containing protein [Thioalkalivibrio sp. ALE11]|uniref:type VII toxin-antitoxin system MntA family adenylyltransferase antitoxin n=1 Tax=Thioalkalivibrio sp. ALE11 TaxID=1265494 RepID=UPI00037F1034|nr:nucleotidyltransferase domain-containing protein [Thioalkalivibrio sp. ALE11]
MTAALTIETIAERVKRVFARYREVDAVFLFGSRAEGRAREGSDIDLALVGPAGAIEPRRLDILTDLAREGLDAVDLVLLDGADPALRFEAVRPNCLLHAGPDFDRGSYYSLALREYFDFEPYLRVQREALKERLLDGQA